ncbi:MAG: hypothetical protein QG567_1231 [Campylobacterota bacterium]|nr:hypothetical protein [Campylobacterota bacterium]
MIFFGTLGMIVWTVVSAVNTPVHEDDVFFESYGNMDEKFNKIVSDNKKIKSLYEIEFEINSNKRGLEFGDIFSSRNMLEENNPNANMLLVGENVVLVSIKDKQGNIVKDAKIEIKISRATNKNSDIFIENLKLDGTDKYIAKFKINSVGNWNISAKVDISGTIGYLFLKTSAK